MLWQQLNSGTDTKEMGFVDKVQTFHSYNTAYIKVVRRTYFKLSEFS